MRFGLSLGMRCRMKRPSGCSEQLTESRVIKASCLRNLTNFWKPEGFVARRGANHRCSIVRLPASQHPGGEPADQGGQMPEDWSEQKKRQKDTECPLDEENGQTYYGYKEPYY